LSTSADSRRVSGGCWRTSIGRRMFWGAGTSGRRLRRHMPRHRSTRVGMPTWTLGPRQ
jgi:hypothetical protein